MEMTGDRQLERKLLKLGDRVARRVLRKALSAAASPVVKSAKSHVEVDEGLLKKALGKKVVVDKRRKRSDARVGARSNIVATDDQGNKVEPWRYSHLVELGHINEDGTHTPPHPFLRTAADETGDRAADILETKLVDGVMKEAANG